MARRSKVLAILLFPIVAPMLLVGWSLYFFGSSNRIKKAAKLTEKKCTNLNFEAHRKTSSIF
jgi:hypothetical protein